MKNLFRVQGPLLALIGAMFLIFFAQCLLGHDWYVNYMVVSGEVVQSWHDLLAGKATSSDWLEFGTLFTGELLHGSFEHILFNMLYLWIFGALISELLGWRWMFLLFLVTAVGASTVDTILNRDQLVSSLGASGAVMGFEGAYLGLATRWRLPNPHIWPMSSPVPPVNLALVAVIGVGIDYFSMMSKVESNTAYGAHVGGFTVGLLFAALIMPRPRTARAR